MRLGCSAGRAGHHPSHHQHHDRGKQNAAGVPHDPPPLRDRSADPEARNRRVPKFLPRGSDGWLKRTGRLAAGSPTESRATTGGTGPSASRIRSGKRSGARPWRSDCRPRSSSAKRCWRSRGTRKALLRGNRSGPGGTASGQALEKVIRLIARSHRSDLDLEGFYRLRVRRQSFRKGRSQMSFFCWARFVCLS